MRFFLRKDIILPIIIFYVSLLVRIFYYSFNPVLSRDSVTYIFLSLKFNPSYDPKLFVQLYKALISFLHYFLSFFPINVSAVAFNIAFGSAFCSIVYYILKSFFNTKKSFFSSLLFSVHPTFVKLSTQIQRETLYLLFSLVVFLIILNIIKDSYLSFIQAVLAGVFCGLAIMTRIEALELIFILMLVLALKQLESFSWNRFFKSSLFSLFFILSVALTLICIFILSDSDFNTLTFLIRNHFDRRF